MATPYAVENDIRNNCGKAEGNRPGLYKLENAWLYYGGKDHGLQPYVQKIYIFEVNGMLNRLSTLTWHLKCKQLL